MNEELKVIISASVDGFKHAINEATEGIEGIEGSSNKMKDTISGAIDFITNKYTMLAAGAVATGKAMFDAAMKSAATADEIDKQSQKIGLSRQAYQELDYVLSQNGASMSNMSGAMKTLTSAMDSASKGNVNAANTFKMLGVSITNADGTLKSQEEVLWDTIAAIQSMEDGTEKAALASDLFGKSSMDLMPLLNSEAGSVDELRAKANELGMVLGDDLIDSGVAATDAMDTIKRTFGAVTTQLAAALLPAIVKVSDLIIKYMPQIKAIVGGTVDAVIAGVSGVVKVLTGTWNVIQTTKQKFTDGINAIKNLFNFKVSWPHIPMPHFSVSGSANPLRWLDEGVPHLSVSWYAKGGVFDKPTLAAGIGEAGAEAVVPLENNTEWLTKIADMLSDRMGSTGPIVLQVDGKTFAEVSVNSINQLTKQKGYLPLAIG